jgi:hypothetical protein
MDYSSINERDPPAIVSLRARSMAATMPPLIRSLAAALAAFLFALPAGVALAVPRTFVASFGNDANACTRALPCRSFGTALSAVDAGGEIVVIDSAGYGGVAIDRSVTIVAPPGVYAGISVTSGDAIAIATPSLDVTLRGLTLNGLGTGGRGVAVTAASRVSIEECVIAAFAGQGIEVDADGAITRIARSNVYGNGNRGVSISGTSTVAIEATRVHGHVHGPGVHAQSGAHATITHSSIGVNRRGVTVFGDRVGFETRLAITDSVVADSQLSGLWVRTRAASTSGFAQAMRVRVTGSGNEGLFATAVDGGAALLAVERSTVSGNASGIVNGGSAGATIVVSGSTIAGNAGFGLQQAGGTVLSRGNNAVHDNNGGGAQTSGTITPVGPM